MAHGKPKVVDQILNWARSYGIVGMGCWGRWEHMNSDIAVAEAMQIADGLIGRMKA